MTECACVWGGGVSISLNVWKTHESMRMNVCVLVPRMFLCVLVCQCVNMREKCVNTISMVNTCMYLCVCVCEREREGGGSVTKLLCVTSVITLMCAFVHVQVCVCVKYIKVVYAKSMCAFVRVGMYVHVGVWMWCMCVKSVRTCVWKNVFVHIYEKCFWKCIYLHTFSHTKCKHLHNFSHTHTQ